MERISKCVETSSFMAFPFSVTVCNQYITLLHYKSESHTHPHCLLRPHVTLLLLRLGEEDEKMLTEEREHKPGLAKREFCPCRECALFTSATIIACERKLVLYTHFRNYGCFSKVASVSKKYLKNAVLISLFHHRNRSRLNLLVV
ncbi:hypothetical protein YC2023_015194 [Brassica napus]